ncbi:MAG: hypothetical protein RR602_05970 [Longicatena sp.]
MLREVLSAYQLYHIRSLPKRFKLAFISELALNFLLTYYFCYKQTNILSTLFPAMLPIIIYIGLLINILNAYESILDSQNAESIFVKMLPNSKIIFKRSIYSTGMITIIYVLVACILNIIVVQNTNLILKYVYIYSIMLPAIWLQLYISFRQTEYKMACTILINTGVIMLYSCFVNFTCFQLTTSSVALAIAFVLCCMLCIIYIISNINRYVKGRWNA